MRPPNSRSGHRETLDKVPPFLLKLYEIVENNSTPVDGSRPCVSWGPSGKSFIIHETETFARNVLPLYFKHDNIRSFMRQLNIYNFTRCPKKANSTGNPNAVEFSHPNFMRGCMHMLSEFKRVVPNNSKSNSAAAAQAAAHVASAAQSPNGAGPSGTPSLADGAAHVKDEGGMAAPNMSMEEMQVPMAGAEGQANRSGPTISALREEVMTLKDNIAHLEQEMLHHTSVTHDHMKKLAALIVSFQEAPAGPLGAGPLGANPAQPPMASHFQMQPGPPSCMQPLNAPPSAALPPTNGHFVQPLPGACNGSGNGGTTQPLLGDQAASAAPRPTGSRDPAATYPTCSLPGMGTPSVMPASALPQGGATSAPVDSLANPYL